MTRKQLDFREKANIEKYVHNDTEASIDAIMELCERIPNSVEGVKLLYRYRSLNSEELDSLENETIFMRWPSSYDDKNDCTPVFDFEEINKYIIEKNIQF